MVSYRRSSPHIIIVALTDHAVFVADRSHNIITVKLGDFGLATFAADNLTTLDADETMTYVGTRAFLAPVRLLLSLPCRVV
jgi:serine/threonine protein kinase